MKLASIGNLVSQARVSRARLSQGNLARETIGTMGLYIDRLLSAASLVLVIILLRHTGNRKNLHGLALPDYKKLMQPSQLRTGR